MTNNITDKIKALFAKAHGTDNEHEAEIFAAKAAQLMAEHNLTRGDLKDPDEYGTRPMVAIKRNVYGLARIGLLARITTANGIFTLYREKHTPSGWVYEVDGYGHLPTIDACELLFTQLDAFAARHMKTVQASAGGSTTSARRSWLLGFSWEIGQRLEAANKTADADAEGCLLPVLADEKVRAEQIARELTTRWSPSRMSGARDSAAAAAGQSAGATVDIGGPRVGATRAQIGAGR